MIATGGTLSSIREKKLPSDAMHCVFAFSLSRNLRKKYNGAWFQYRQDGQTKEYPVDAIDITKPAFLIKLYDQKVRHGVPVADAEQTDPAKQPSLSYSGTVTAAFELGQYLDIPGIASFIGRDFTITSVGKGDVPRPMVGVWGASDKVTVEPGDPVSMFTFNERKCIVEDASESVMSCFSGYDPTQNNHRVLSVRTGTDEVGTVTQDEAVPTFTNASIGRADQRMFKGEFSEAYLHLGDLTKIGADKQFESAREEYG